MLNHSCCNNVGFIFDGDFCYGLVLEEIGQGDELTMNYGTNLLYHDKRERKTRMKDRYGFDCECRACELENCRKKNFFFSIINCAIFY